MTFLYGSSGVHLAIIRGGGHHTRQIGAAVSPHETRTYKMSILTHGFDRPFGSERPARISGARKAQLKSLALGALTLLTMGSVLTALIALKTAIYVWHMHG